MSMDELNELIRTNKFNNRYNYLEPDRELFHQEYYDNIISMHKN
jgi:hypothetical protein